MRVRTTISSLVAAAALAATGVAVAPVAHAAPTCDSTSLWGYTNNTWFVKPTAGYNTYNTNCVLSQGASGSGVGALQDAANKCYGQGLVYDGQYGPATAQAVRNIQNFHGISVDGVFGPQTSGAMVWPKYDSALAFVGCWF